VSELEKASGGTKENKLHKSKLLAIEKRSRFRIDGSIVKNLLEEIFNTDAVEFPDENYVHVRLFPVKLHAIIIRE
jgi:hypothetical protein